MPSVKPHISKVGKWWVCRLPKRYTYTGLGATPIEAYHRWEFGELVCKKPEK